MVDRQAGLTYGHPRSCSSALSSHNEKCGASSSIELALRGLDIIFPWVLASLIGMCTAATGLFIAMNCDFLSDLRFGACNGMWYADRNRCCGGAENINVGAERCKQPQLAMNVTSEAGGSFRYMDWVTWEERLSISSARFFVYVAISVTLSVLSSLLVHSYCPPAKGSGIPDVKAAMSGFSISRSFSAICLLIKAVGLSLAVGAGLALGKEGPFIQMGVCWAYMLRNSGGPLGALSGAVPLHELICIGAAAGVSTAFGAPIGGVLFAVEELGGVRTLTRRALLLAFAGSFVASFTLKSWNIYGSNQITLFNISTPTNSAKKEWISWEISLFLLLGILGGFVGSLFIQVNVLVAKRRRRLGEVGRVWLLPCGLQSGILKRLPGRLLQMIATEPKLGADPRLVPLAVHVAEIAVIATITASLNYPFTHLLRMPMVEVIHGLFEICPHSLSMKLGLCEEGSHLYSFALDGSLVASLLLAAVVRLFETTITFGALIPSGLFIPSLYVGATLGRLVGILTLKLNLMILGHSRTTQIDSSVFAMVGAVAVLSGFARMTVSLVVIMLELTGELSYAVPFMCAVLAAKLVGDFFTVSIYDAYSVLLGYAMIEEPKDVRMSPRVVDVAKPCGIGDVFDMLYPISVGALRATLGPLVRRTPLDEGAAGKDGWCCAQAAQDVEVGTVAGGTADVHIELSELKDGRAAGAKQRCGLSTGFGAPQPVLEAGALAAGTSEVCVLVKGQNRARVYGVVEKERLLHWLQGHDSVDGPVSDSAICSFAQTASFRTQSLAANCLETLDASDLVETAFVRFLASAPVLTAVCAFREDQRLRYCVCRDEADGCALSVLSREGLERALTERLSVPTFRIVKSPQPSLPLGRFGALVDWLR